MVYQSITSFQNPKIKHAVKLSQRKDRDREGLLVVEGRDEIVLALQGGLRPFRLFYSPGLRNGSDSELLGTFTALGGEVIEISPQLMEKIAYRQHPDAWLCIAFQPETSLSSMKHSSMNQTEATGSTRDQSHPSMPLYLITEGIEKPGNFGAMLRTADACGVQGVISLGGKTDLFNPNVVRASKGSIFTVPIAAADNQQVYEWLEEQNITIVAADPHDAKPYWEVSYRRPCAIVVGSEDQGLSEFWKKNAHELVTIPMVGTVNSLNVALSAGLLLYEAIRQRTGT